MWRRSIWRFPSRVVHRTRWRGQLVQITRRKFWVFVGVFDFACDTSPIRQRRRDVPIREEWRRRNYHVITKAKQQSIYMCLREKCQTVFAYARKILPLHTASTEVSSGEKRSTTTVSTCTDNDILTLFPKLGVLTLTYPTWLTRRGPPILTYVSGPEKLGPTQNYFLSRFRLCMVRMCANKEMCVCKWVQTSSDMERWKEYSVENSVEFVGKPVIPLGFQRGQGDL